MNFNGAFFLLITTIHIILFSAAPSTIKEGKILFDPTSCVYLYWKLFITVLLEQTNIPFLLILKKKDK